MWRRLLDLSAMLVANMLAANALAATFYPCSPVFIAGPQGRPIPNAVVNVVNLDGSSLTNGVWLNDTGTQPFVNLLPANQILQVFADPGVYRVEMTGAGLTKIYEIVCTTGVGSGIKLVSVDRTADLLLISTDTPPTRLCGDNVPCVLEYDPLTSEFATFDFRMPSSFPLTFITLTLQWQANGHPSVGDRVVWRINWCAFTTGQPICDPSGQNQLSKVATVTAAVVAQDVTFDINDIAATAWSQGDHVVVSVMRDGLDSRENAHSQQFVIADLINVQLEFSR